jgi:hypothetical protein
MPAERTQILRRAFDATMKDPAFVADADKGQWEITPVTGEEIEKLMARLYQTPPAVIELAKQVTPQPR